MAVQKSKKTRSKRGMRRAHDSLTSAELTTDQMSGEVHRRHHVAADGYYKGQEIVVDTKTDSDE